MFKNFVLSDFFPNSCVHFGQLHFSFINIFEYVLFCIFSSDIGLVKLPSPVKFTDAIQPVNLACSTSYDADVIAIGSGKMNSQITTKNNSPNLHYAHLKTVSQLKCFRHLPIIAFRKSIICSRGEEKQSICIGDSGSPLIEAKSQNLVGISSFGLALFGCQRDVSQGLYFIYFTYIVDNNDNCISYFGKLPLYSTIYRISLCFFLTKIHFKLIILR